MYQEHTLDNGLRIFCVPLTNFQSVSVAIFVNIGSRYEPVAQAGLSHLIEHMLFKGTTRRPTAKIIAETIEGIGGISNAYTAQETTVYYAKVAAHHASTALDVLADMIRHPLFKPEDLEKERYIIAEEINMTYDSPEDWAGILLEKLMWPDHPLGSDVAGTHESLAGIGQDEVRSFYGTGYHPHNLLVAIGGAFDSDKIIADLNRLLGDWQAVPKPTFEPAPAPQNTPRWCIEHRSIEQGHLYLALPALHRTHPDRYALSVLNAILGDGMSSRLFLNIREQLGLAYAVDSGISLLHDTGTLAIYAGVDPSRAVEALQAILDELARLRDEPVAEAELRRAKEYLKGRLALGLEDSFSQTAWVASQALLMERIKMPTEVLQTYDAVTTADVQAIARKIINPTAYNLAAVGPFEDNHQLGRLLGG